MKTLTIKQPFASLIIEGQKNMNLELGKQIIEAKY